MKKLNFILAILCLTLFSINAQNVAINDDNSNADANAILDVKSTTKGVLFPRLTTAQRTTLGNATPTEGMLVFDTDTKSYWFFASGAWVDLSSGSGDSVPAGTIIAFGGSVSQIPTGYYLCDGSSKDKNAESDLFDAIGTSWGGDANPNFNLPDLRGVFLRGVNLTRMDAYGDPDSTSTHRKNIFNGGNEGNKVGSFQGDEFDSHNHGGGNHNHSNGGTSGYFMYNTGNPNWDISSSNGEVNVINDIPHSGTIISTQGGSETRPRNAYVHYIIKH